ncbi:MAG: hypothetical protein ACXAEN_19205, partial [Candidatus Thorarchaeota archaeon]
KGIEDGDFVTLLQRWDIAEVNELLSELKRTKAIDDIMFYGEELILAAINRLGLSDDIAKELDEMDSRG